MSDLRLFFFLSLGPTNWIFARPMSTTLSLVVLNIFIWILVSITVNINYIPVLHFFYVL